jgi:hypothetical protein
VRGLLGLVCVVAGCGASEVRPGSSEGCGGEGGAEAELICDADDDGFLSLECGGDDCNDNAPQVYPGADDTCDGEDNACDGTIDLMMLAPVPTRPPSPDLPYADRVCLRGGRALH